MAWRFCVCLFVAAALAGCAALQKPFPKPAAALKPGDYVISGRSAGFYSSKPRKDQKPEVELKAGTRVTLIKQSGTYSLVKLADKSVGYAATGSLSVAPAKAEKKKPAKPSATSEKKPEATPEKKPEPEPQAEKPSSTPAPKPTPEVEPEAAQTPAPEVPQFRY